MDEDELVVFDEELKLVFGVEDVFEFIRDLKNLVVGQFVIKSVF